MTSTTESVEVIWVDCPFGQRLKDWVVSIYDAVRWFPPKRQPTLNIKTAPSEMSWLAHNYSILGE